MVVGWVFGGVWFHAKIKGVELSYDLDYVILSWSWILSAFSGCIRISWILSAFFSWIYPRSVDIIRISWILSAFCGYYLHWPHYEIPSL